MKAHDDGSGGWLFGKGVGMSDMKEQRFPNRYDLDRISEERPILIFSHCLHFMLLNSKALQLVGVPGKTAPKDEYLTYLSDGEPDGIMMEAASTKYVTAAFDALYADADYRLGIVRDGLYEYPKHGLTTLHCISGLPGGPPFEFFDQYYRLERDGVLPVRTVISSTYLPALLNPTTGYGTDMVKVGAKKIYMDGSFGGRTAAMLEPYSDDPKTNGNIFYSLDETVSLLKEAYDAGIEAAVHAIGDAAMERVITAAEAVYPRSDEPDPVKRLKAAGLRRLRIIHASIAIPEHIERMRHLPVIIDAQPKFIDSDGFFIHDRLGPDRTNYYLPLKSFIEAGLIATGGSDAPVDPASPLSGIECAVTRREIDGAPGSELAPEEAVSVYDAVSMYTRNAAYCSSEEDLKGTISAGKYADFILLDRDIFKVESNEISEIKVVQTVLGGDTKYRGN
jgi:predicted amidohydrolase YtcJ